MRTTVLLLKLCIYVRKINYIRLRLPHSWSSDTTTLLVYETYDKWKDLKIVTNITLSA